MAGKKILGLILAGGAGGRMDVLSDVRAKPALPYAGVYRLIDFPLSNCVHSGLSDVWVIEQYQPQSLNDHLANGRPWDLDRTYGGLQVFPPFQGKAESGWHEGNADALYRNRSFIREFDPELVLVMSADHIYKLDYRHAIDAHSKFGADVTMVTTEVPIEQAGRFGTVQVDEDGKVTGFEYKPDEPKSGIVTTEVFAYNPEKLLSTLEELATGGDGESSGLEDFGNGLLPRLVEEGGAYEYRLDGYWKDVGTPDSYLQSHIDLLEPEPVLNLDDLEWPILTQSSQRPPARIMGTAQIENSLISSGCAIRGRVVRSVVGPGVVVEEGACVQDSVVFQNTIIREGATVQCAIIDQDARVGKDARVGALPKGEDGEPSSPTADQITLVGRSARIAARKTIEAGGRVQPGEGV